MSPPTTSVGIQSLAAWIQQTLSYDFGANGSEIGERAASVMREHDISPRVFRSLEKDDITQLFPFMSFGQRRTIQLLVSQAKNQPVQQMPPPPVEYSSQPFPLSSQLETASQQQQRTPRNSLSLSHDVTPGQSSQTLSTQPQRQSHSGEEKSSGEKIPIKIAQIPSKDRQQHQHRDAAFVGSAPSLSPTTRSNVVEEKITCSPPRVHTKRRGEIQNDRVKRFRTDKGIDSDGERNRNHLLSQKSKQRLWDSAQDDEFFVCIVGPSGVGKSSALNAVLDGCDVLPTSSMHASTAVPIEIRYKKGAEPPAQDTDSDDMPYDTMSEEITQFLTTEAAGDKRFLAKIDFISKAAWKDILRKAVCVLQRKARKERQLQHILMGSNGDAEDSVARKAAMEQHFESDANDDRAGEAALAAVKAVLGEAKFLTMEEAETLCERPKHAAILKHLGQSLRFSFDKCRDVSRRIARFLATSKNRGSAAVWPLVKSARIFGPWKMLSSGMVLVDLPGLQDANSARNEVVARYIHRCHAIISAAKISRARDNKTTHDLLTGPIRAGIESRRVSFVGFIATHSDDVRPSEIVEDLGKSFCQNYGKGLQQAGILDKNETYPSIDNIKRQVSLLDELRRKSKDLENGDLSDDESVSKRQCQIVDLSRNLHSACISARNGFVQGALKGQFMEEMNSIPKSQLPLFRVFCVSSTQYTSIMRDGCAEISRDFTDVRLTGIPELCDCLWSLSTTSQATRDQGKLDTEAAFRSTTTSDGMDDENAGDNREALSSYLQSVLKDSTGEGDADAERIRARMEKMAKEAVAARDAELCDAKKRVQSRSSYLKEIILLNETGAGALLTFLERCKSSSSNIASARRIQMWLDQARENSKQTNARGATIAILGDSGSGKSSLLNALLDLDGDDVLPVSGVRACTAAPVAITYCEGGGFRAQIEFLGVDEWHNELRQLTLDLEEASKTQLKRKMQYFERPRSELGRIAYDKIVSVYGRIASYISLVEEHCMVERRLGTTAKLHATSAKAIRQKLGAYCSSGSHSHSSNHTGNWDESGRLWPLVRVAHVQGPFKVLADSKGCLLDLPGLQDSNAARNTVVQSYLGSCSGFIIAAPIKRAVDNRTARELLGRQFRRQLLLDGRINSVAFAATQTDDIDALQVASELGIPGISSYSGMSEEDVTSKFSKHARKISQLRKKIRTLAKKKSDLGSCLKKEKDALERARARGLMGDREGDNRDCSENLSPTYGDRLDRVDLLNDELSQIQAVISKLTSELASREHVLNNVCSLARNEYCRSQVREDFVEGIQEILDGAFTKSLDESPEGVPQLPVFPTSSRDFRHLSQNQTEHAKAFYTVDETGIPKLFQFVRHNMLISRINAETERTERLAVLVSSVSQYLLMECRATPSQQSSLTTNMERILNGIDTDVNSLASQAMSQLNRILLDGPMKETLTLGEVKARQSATANLVKVEGSVHWATYRACLRRLGVYVSPTAGPMNLNESLMAPLMETVIPSWREAFGTGVSKILQRFVMNASKMADSTLADVAREVTRSGLSATPLEGAGELRLLAKKTFDMALVEAHRYMEKEFEGLQRDCWRELPGSVVQRALIHGYSKANDERGTGSVARLKGHMRSEVRCQRSRMFDKCVVHVSASVKKVLKQVSTIISAKLKTCFACLQDDIEVLWDSQCDLSREKCVCLAHALKNLTRLVEKIGIGSLALKKSTDGVDFDSVDSARSILPVLDDTLELASLPLIDENMLNKIIPLTLEEEETVEAGYYNEGSEKFTYRRNVKHENNLHASNRAGQSQGQPSLVMPQFSDGSASESQPILTPLSPDSDEGDWPPCF